MLNPNEMTPKDIRDLLIDAHLNALKKETTMIYLKHFSELNDMSSYYDIIFDPTGTRLWLQSPNHVDLKITMLSTDCSEHVLYNIKGFESKGIDFEIGSVFEYNESNK